MATLRALLFSLVISAVHGGGVTKPSGNIILINNDSMLALFKIINWQHHNSTHEYLFIGINIHPVTLERNLEDSLY